ncbi:ATP-cone domain protein [[Leptolyngbya] sp. PCC 7376]|uniref:NrdR family transcriptional regulator n=1 Tax=[Leptolyngbya] sp. PCC 7376 TaxID=111781 RepID=UPI00029ED784|nr:hypothetical protein [[Leptolyngbya] sp. PCC 7376]AFY39873.1 ATP-cone domain protein [[Leptolyngbya] sp. PCC 7376]
MSDLCVICNGETKVIESRRLNNAKRRRRECLHCTHRFTTYETLLKDPDLEKILENLENAQWHTNHLLDHLKHLIGGIKELTHQNLSPEDSDIYVENSGIEL